jgi:hypothetical protein
LEEIFITPVSSALSFKNKQRLVSQYQILYPTPISVSIVDLTFQRIMKKTNRFRPNIVEILVSYGKSIYGNCTQKLSKRESKSKRSMF